jgi:hypothetical protein
LPNIKITIYDFIFASGKITLPTKSGGSGTIRDKSVAVAADG